MIRQMALVAVIGSAFLAMQPVFADEAWDQLEAEFERALEKWHESMDKLQETMEQPKGAGAPIMLNPGAMPPHPIEEFRPRFRKYAEQHEGKPEAVPALGHMLMGGFSMMVMMGEKDKSAEWALSRLKEDHAADPQIAEQLEQVGHAVMTVGEDPVIEFMEAVAEKNPDPKTRGKARLALAAVLYEGSPLVMMMPGRADTPESKAKRKRAVKMLRDLKEQFAGTDLGEQANDFLFAIEHLQVGMKAPEISGRDPDGREIRMSQFEGRVVAIVFWATWCAPCMEMLPHERALLKKHAGKPFTILGINVDEALADCKKAITQEKITWPTIFDGSPEVGTITRKWRVRSFPTIYVIDHQGVIRHKNLMPFELERVVDTLVAKATAGDTKAEGDG